MTSSKVPESIVEMAAKAEFMYDWDGVPTVAWEKSPQGLRDEYTNGIRVAFNAVWPYLQSMEFINNAVNVGFTEEQARTMADAYFKVKANG